ncbi:F-box protein [Cardamine amara subsp. amara]|uniref:F-box protein n=1 Tax=Cardamine amara subsp. amara TaxID=228776 RepID=A0ABD1ANQ4_CARAN
MKISDLPSVLIEEIFARVPLKSLRAVRNTCKSWNILSKSESFIKMYTSKAATSTREEEKTMMMIAMIGFNLYLLKVVVGDPDPFIVMFKSKPSFLSRKFRISHVYNCEGLLLCILEDDDTKVVVWNPHYGQTRWIKTRYPHRSKGYTKYSLGYKNNESSRSFKLLRFLDLEFLGCEIYDLDSGLWTTVDVNPQWCLRDYHGSFGISLKGNTYWCVAERNIYNAVDHIIYFDFTRERFGPLLPLPSTISDYNTSVTLSCVREEKLAVLFQQSSTIPTMEIWITTKINAEMVSWSKFLTIDYGPDYIDGGFFIDEDKKVAMGFNEDSPNLFSIIGKDGYLENFYLKVPRVEYNRPDVFSYVPSLIQIKTPAQGKKKRQS